MSLIQELVPVFAQLRPSSTFVSVKEYKNNEGELSNFKIIFHVSYLKALQNSLEITKNFITSSKLEEKAKFEVMNSIQTSIDNFKIQSIEEREDSYFHFTDYDGKFIKGLMAHKNTYDLYMYGFLLTKEVLVSGSYKIINSSALTLAKKKIRNMTPVSRFRQFKILPNRFKEIKVEGITISSDQYIINTIQ